MKEESKQQMDQMQREWNTWQDVVAELRARIAANEPEVDLNDDPWLPAIRAIECWGEELVSLRLEQSPETRERVRTEKRDSYEGVRTVEPKSL